MKNNIGPFDAIDLFDNSLMTKDEVRECFQMWEIGMYASIKPEAWIAGYKRKIFTATEVRVTLGLLPLAPIDISHTA